MTDFVFNKFDTVENVALRTYNRVVFMLNIKEDFGDSKVTEYIEMFNQAERQQMFLMMSYIKNVGQEAAKAMVMRNAEPTEA